MVYSAGGKRMEKICLCINGEEIAVESDPSWTLLYLLREELNLTGTKSGCNTGDCGACKVIIDGEAVNSCLVPARNAQGKSIETVEGLAKNGELHPLQKAFIDCGAVQCGYCTPGMLMCAKALLDNNDSPTEQEIREALENNLCRCTGYVPIIKAIQTAAVELRDLKELEQT